jgi:hypothetical protein
MITFTLSSHATTSTFMHSRLSSIIMGLGVSFGAGGCFTSGVASCLAACEADFFASCLCMFIMPASSGMGRHTGRRLPYRV